jgi:hypothetical protein
VKGQIHLCGKFFAKCRFACSGAANHEDLLHGGTIPDNA